MIEDASPQWPAISFRVLFSVMFVAAGVEHFFRPTVFVERMLKSPIGRFVAELASAEILVVVAGIVLLVAGAGLLLGYRGRSRRSGTGTCQRL